MSADTPSAADVREVIRDCFLNMIADADRFDEDVDGDADDYGRIQITVNYHLTVGHSQLTELAESLGIKARCDETIQDAIFRAIDEDAAHASALEALNTETNEMVALSQGRLA